MNKETTMATLEDVFGPVISSYSRAQAIEDGVLVDVTEYASRAGFRHPVAVTSGLLAEMGQENIYSTLKRAVQAVRDSDKNTDRIEFSYLGVDMYAVCGPGDTAEPVITIMLLGED